MSDVQLLLLLILILLLALITLICVTVISRKQSKQNRLIVNRSKPSFFLFRSYCLFSRNFLTKKYIQSVRRRIELMELSDQWTIACKTMKFVYIACGSTAGMLLVLILMRPKLYFFILGCLTLWVIHNQILRGLLEKIDHKLMIQFDKFLENVRHRFHEHGMIDEAIYDTIEVCEYEMSLHAAKMYEVLTSEDGENALLDYYDMVPNKFFKTFLALCYTVQKYGDQVIDGKSMLLTNLNYLKQEINMEQLRRSQIVYLFKSLAIISVLPIFCLPLLEMWAKHFLPELGEYYEGAYGFVVQIVLFFAAGLSYELICKMQSNIDEAKSNAYRIEKKLLSYPKLRKLIQYRVYRKYSKAQRTERLLRTVGEKASIECFYLRGVLWGLAACIISVIVFSYSHYITKHNILNREYSSNLEIKHSRSDSIEDWDNFYIKKYHNKKLTYNQLEEAILKDKEIDQKQAGIVAKRIWDKRHDYENQYFKWWELIISICIGFVFCYLPKGILVFRKTVLYMNMEDEVMQFHTIILMLMHIERMSVEELLEWMSMFAVLFKNSIDTCLNDFESGDIQALEELKKEEPFTPFLRIVENLQMAADKLPIRQVFDELASERLYYQEKRKQDYQVLIEKKGLWGKLIAFAPMSLTVVLYLILPFIHLSILQFITYSEQMKIYL